MYLLNNVLSIFYTFLMAQLLAIYMQAYRTIFKYCCLIILKF